MNLLNKNISACRIRVWPKVPAMGLSHWSYITDYVIQVEGETLL